ncbi:MAG TPA: di-heme oxidoredictase family protein [Burkholderiaceae bacterium]|nr:di-heme oxidoredictase family protein [Burkholderiaceae bacterium]
MKRTVLAAFALAGCVTAPVPPIGTEPDVPATGGTEAMTGFDGQSNGFVTADIFQADQEEFDGIENIADGLGPLYNAQSCRECHQNPLSGGGSQVSEFRAGHLDAQGRFQAPRVPIARGTVFIEGRTLINDRAICPNAQFPDQEIQEHVPDTETIRTQRLSISLLGDGLVEAVADEFLRGLAARQCKETQGQICGLVVEVPVLEASDAYRVGRFGWKNQQATLLSFAADAYLNEMGITSRLQPDEVTKICDTVPDPEDNPAAQPSPAARQQARAARAPATAAAVEQPVADIDRFARFVRATKAPPRDTTLAATEGARRGSEVFDRAGCATCHVRTLVTAAEGTKINGGTFSVPAALANRLFHPFGDFLLHNVGTGDGIEISILEHHGRRFAYMQDKMSPTVDRIRTAPLWGLRMRSRLMHDGLSVTVRDAIGRHGGEATDARRRFDRLGDQEQSDLLTFLQSL